MSKTVLAVIPARGGSKGIPGKNMIDIGGRPLIDYTIQTIHQSNKISKVIVSTDSIEIGDYCQKRGVNFPFIRPKELSGDKAKSIDVVIHTLNWCRDHGENFDFILLLQPTTPFRNANFIDSAIEQLVESNKNCLISVKPVPHEYNPNWQFRILDGDRGITSYEDKVISRRQDLSLTYVRDGGIYLVRVDFLLKTKSFFDDEMEFIVNNDHPPINLDTLNDLAIARNYVSKS